MASTKLYACNVADWDIDYSLLVQFQNIGENYTFKTPFYLIDHPEGVVMVDTGPALETKTDPENYGPYGTPHMAEFTEGMYMTEEDEPVNQLAELGYEPEDIDYVIMSHLHHDHAGNIRDFPDAEFIVHKDELQYAGWADGIQQLFYLEGDFGMLRSDEFDVTAVEDRHDLFGDGTIETIPTPGHTPGHQCVKVDLDNTGTVILACDLAHLRQGYEEDLCTAFDWSMPEMMRSFQKIRDEVEREDAMITFLHDVGDWEELPDAPDYLD